MSRFPSNDNADTNCPQCGAILDHPSLYAEPHTRADKPETPCVFVRVFEVRFFEADVHDGDFPRDDTWEDIDDCTPDDDETSVELAIGYIRGRYLTSEDDRWFTQPNGSEMNHGTGKRAEVSAHLYGFTDAEMALIHAGVNA